jgi:hypothetical protein
MGCGGRGRYLSAPPSGEGSARTAASSWAGGPPSSRPGAWCEPSRTGDGRRRVEFVAEKNLQLFKNNCGAPGGRVISVASRLFDEGRNL